MSERTHSPDSAPRRGKLIPIVSGTLILVAAACVWLQFFGANPAVSQTDAGAARVQANANANVRVMARVNNQAITYDELAAQCVAIHGREVLEAAISRMMIQQECQRKGVQVTAADVKAEVEATAKKFNLPLDTWYKMLETERGITVAQYQNDVIWPMLALKKLAGESMTVTEEEMRIGFERDYGPRVKARMIVVDGTVRQAAEIHATCMASPADFERIAREKSSDGNTRALGGVIPPIRRHGGNKNLEDAAFKLREGEISSIIQWPDVENKWIILKCEGRTEPVVTDIRDVWEDMLAQLKEEKVQKEVARVFDDIQTRSRVDNLLTNESKGPRNPVQPVSGQVPPAQNRNVVPAAGGRGG